MGGDVPQLTRLGGVYCEDCDIAEPAAPGAIGVASGELDADALTSGVRPHATDPEQAARLWELSAALTGVDAFAPTS